MTATGGYANPNPYPNADVERAMLAGRINTARAIRDTYHDTHDHRETRWNDAMDQLLEHYTNAEARAAHARQAQP